MMPSPAHSTTLCPAPRTTSLLQTALRLRRLGVAPAARAALGALGPALRRQLLSAAPRLGALDLLKLSWLLRELA